MQFAELQLLPNSYWSLMFGRAEIFQWIDDLPKLTVRTLVGIIIAVTGNVLISLALNLQKLAHRRMEEAKNASTNEGESGSGYDEHDDEDIFLTNARTTRSQESELQPLISRTEPLIHEYGTQSPNLSQQSTPRRSFVSRLNPVRRKNVAPNFVLPVDIISEDAALHRLTTIRRKSPTTNDEDPDPLGDKESDYLKSKLWWSGFLLMNVGETGNFISYAFAPASMVAPLGTFALMANCFFAPLLLGEQFKKRDLLGVIIAIIGAVTVVLASNVSEARLDSGALLRAILSTPFVVYSCVYLVGVICLATLSEGKIGKNFVFVDVGLCALFGGFTVLSTKALSTLLTLQWIEIFTHRISYILLLVLILTGVGQIRYLNRALMRFDSKVVIPIQFVFFTLSAIIGSAILYGDFKTANFHEIITFLYGCTATFAGVFIIAWSPKESVTSPPHDSDNERNEAASAEDAEVGLDGPYLGPGSIGRRRRRATLVLPSGVRASSRDVSPLQRKPSSLATIGISPAQHLLLVHSPPRDVSGIGLGRPEGEEDVERGSVGSSGRRRTQSWYGNDAHRARNENSARDTGTIAKRRDGSGLPLGNIEGSAYIPAPR